jgi:hypothetical protein
MTFSMCFKLETRCFLSLFVSPDVCLYVVGRLRREGGCCNIPVTGLYLAAARYPRKFLPRLPRENDSYYGKESYTIEPQVTISGALWPISLDTGNPEGVMHVSTVCMHT